MSKARIYRASLTGTAPVAGKGRVYRVGMTGAAAVIVNPIASLSNVEPESPITLAASLVGGGSADSWTWRKVSGLDVGITGTGATLTFPAPSALNGGTVVVGVRATKDGVQSPEVQVSISVLPQTEWFWGDTGWIPNVQIWGS